MLPPLRQCDSMDTDDPEPQAAQPPPQLSEDVRDELMHWMVPTRHSAFFREAMPWPGYTLQPDDFTAQPLPLRIYAALSAIDQAETQRQQAVDPPIRRRSPPLAVPPGFEASVAARTAVTTAMTGLRRSSREPAHTPQIGGPPLSHSRGHHSGAMAAPHREELPYSSDQRQT